MHIHASSMNINSASLYSAAGAEKAAEAQRAANVRKKLLKGASEIEAAPDPGETFLIGKWLDPQHSPVQDPFQNETQYHPSSKVPSFG